MLDSVDGDPVVLEAFGGSGKVFEYVYENVATGIVFEKDWAKVSDLARQRPTWRVYQGDCVKLLAAGVGADLEPNVLDLDPYGSPFESLRAFMTSERNRPKRLDLVVNDGMRNKVQIDGGMDCKELQSYIARFGSQAYQFYLDIAKMKVAEIVKVGGYKIAQWRGYYTGRGQRITHYWAVLEK